MAPVFVEGLAGGSVPREAAPRTRLVPATPVAPAPAPPSGSDAPSPMPQAHAPQEPEAPPEPLEPHARQAPPARTSPLPPTLFTDLDELAKEAARILRVDRVAVWRFLDPAAELETLIRYHRREGAFTRPGAQTPELGEGMRQVFATGKPISVEDAARSHSGAEPLRTWIAEEGIRALILYPVHEMDRLIGCVTFEEDRGPRRWTPHAEELAATLGRQIGLLLSRNGAPAPLVAPEPKGATPTEAVGVPRATAVPVEPIAEPVAPVQEVATIEKLESFEELESVEEEDLFAATAAEPQGVSAPPARSYELSLLERAALLAGDRAPRLVEALEVQRGYLRLLEQALPDRPAELEILAEARAMGSRVEEEIERFLRHLREGRNDLLPLELNALLSGMIALLAREAGEEVRLRIAPSADPIPILGDVALLEVALLHLVRSVREGALPGSDVRISWGRLFASAGGEGGAASEVGLARIRVEGRRDASPGGRGSGFFEAQPARAGEEGVPAQGLAVVRAVAEGHQGWVEARSVAYEAVAIDLFLPLAPNPTGPDPKVPEERVKPAESAPISPNILILEDEPLLARLIEQILKRNGFRTEVAGAPTEAERRWRRLGEDLDLVIVERVLAGGRSGVDLVRRWQKEAPRLGAVLLDRRGSEEGDSDPEFPILRRPFDPADVLTRVREELARRPGRPAATPQTPEPASPTEPQPGTGRMLAH